MGRKITRKEFNDAVMSYAMSTVVITADASDPKRYQWGFQESHGIDVIDNKSFKSKDSAQRAAEWYIRNHCPNVLATARNDAIEWMKYNRHTF